MCMSLGAWIQEQMQFKRKIQKKDKEKSKLRQTNRGRRKREINLSLRIILRYNVYLWCTHSLRRIVTYSLWLIWMTPVISKQLELLNLRSLLIYDNYVCNNFICTTNTKHFRTILIDNSYNTLSFAAFNFHFPTNTVLLFRISYSLG